MAGIFKLFGVNRLFQRIIRKISNYNRICTKKITTRQMLCAIPLGAYMTNNENWYKKTKLAIIKSETRNGTMSSDITKILNTQEFKNYVSQRKKYDEKLFELLSYEGNEEPITECYIHNYTDTPETTINNIVWLSVLDVCSKYDKEKEHDIKKTNTVITPKEDEYCCVLCLKKDNNIDVMFYDHALNMREYKNNPTTANYYSISFVIKKHDAIFFSDRLFLWKNNMQNIKMIFNNKIKLIKPDQYPTKFKFSCPKNIGKEYDNICKKICNMNNPANYPYISTNMYSNILWIPFIMYINDGYRITK